MLNFRVKVMDRVDNGDKTFRRVPAGSLIFRDRGKAEALASWINQTELGDAQVTVRVYLPSADFARSFVDVPPDAIEQCIVDFQRVQAALTLPKPRKD